MSSPLWAAAASPVSARRAGGEAAQPAAQCWPGEDEAVIVKVEFRGEPLCRRLCADEYDHRMGLYSPSLAGVRVLNGHSFQAGVSTDAPHLGAQHHLDGGIGGDSVA